MTNIEGYCNLRHKEALGFYPATHAKLEKHAAAAEADGPQPVTVPSLITIPNVDILAAGSWNLLSGTQEFTTADLAAAVQAAQCPSVGDPVIKIGHNDPNFDGEPAVGRVKNMRLAQEGAKVTADLVGLPGWLGTVAASAYPRRSIEGTYNFACQTGHRHPFVITALALLGVTPPGVGVLSGLPNVAALYGVEAAAMMRATEPEPAGGAMPQITAAAISESDVRRAYYDSEDLPGTYWITELRMDPAELIVADEATSKVFRVPWSIEAGAVKFGDAREVQVTYADVMASLGRATGTAVTFASAGDSRDLPEVAAADAGDGGGQDGGQPASGGTAGPDADGLDASWDDTEGVAEMFAGLDLADLEAIAAAEENRQPEPVSAAKPKLGSGGRAAKLKAAGLSGALIGWIGRHRYGKTRMAKWAAAGRKRKAAHAAAGEITVDAAGRHGTWTGTHSHPHATLGQQGGDQQHDHSHTHSGDGSHAHVHAAQGTRDGGTEVEFTEEQRAALRSALGLADEDELTEEALVTAAGALRERADAKHVAAAHKPLPPGVMAIDKTAWDAVNAKVQAAEQFRARVERGERDTVIAAAVQQGKFGPGQVPHWTRLWDGDPEGTRQVIATLQRNVVPVDDIGQPGSEDDLTPDEYKALFPPDYLAAAPNGIVGGQPAGR